MSKATNTNNSKNLMRLGLAIVILSNPLLYLAIGATIIDIQNIFGASIVSTSPFNEHLVSFLEPGGVSRWAHS